MQKSPKLSTYSSSRSNQKKPASDLQLAMTEKSRNRSFLHFLRAAAKKVLTVFVIRKRKATTTSDAATSTDNQAQVSGSVYSSDFSLQSSTRSSSKVRSSLSYGSSSTGPSGQLGIGNSSFSIQDILKATGNFASNNVIGEGAFGTVYKGKLKDGSFVAVKRAKKKFDQRSSSEFKNEVLTLSKIEHLNLVRLYGYLEHGDERIMVVEYVSNGNLREHLDGTLGNGLEMGERLDITIDVAHAVTYLHTYSDPPIIHRDIKASNILITDKLRAKVADFGFARVASEDPEATHISTQVKGSTGYLDPEYLSTYQLTEKSDVYSFGVLLVEIVTGRHPIESKRQPSEKVTIKWAMQKLRTGDAVLTMDWRIRRSPASVTAVEQILKLARQCLASSRQSRPPMRKCAEVLWGIRKEYKERAAAPVTSLSHQSADFPNRDVKDHRHTSFGIEGSPRHRFVSA